MAVLGAGRCGLSLFSSEEKLDRGMLGALQSTVRAEQEFGELGVELIECGKVEAVQVAGNLSEPVVPLSAFIV